MGYSGWENFVPGNDAESSEKDAKRQIQGRLNRETGAVFEGYIEAACDAYRAANLADVEKTPEPFRVLGPRHRNSLGAWVFEGVFTKQAQPDFKGTLCGGRSVVFEAKTSSDGRIEQRAVTQEQARSLSSHAALGAHAYVFVSLSLRDFYRVPWNVWADMKKQYGRKYMTADELEAFRVPHKNGYLQLFYDEINEVKENE